MSNKGRYLRNDRKDFGSKPKKNNGLKIALIVMSVVLVLVIGLGIAGVVYVNNMMNLVNRPEPTENELSQEQLDDILNYNPDATTEPEEVPTTEPAPTLSSNPADNIINIMVVGQAYREGEETKLADSMILCSLNKETKTLTMTSFLRDMYIKLPDYKGHICGKQRINVCYNLGWHWGGDLGAMEMLNLCLKNNFGIEVDHDIEVNFDVFPDIIDMMGGVDVELTEAEVEYLKNVYDNDKNDYVQVGMNTLNGYTALAYARARKLDGDIQRTNRQRNIITSLINKARTMSISDLNKMAKEVLPMITTNMSNEEMAGYLMTVLPMIKDLKIQSGVIPAEGTYWPETKDIGGYPANVLIPDLNANSRILQEICEGIVPAVK